MTLLNCVQEYLSHLFVEEGASEHYIGMQRYHLDFLAELRDLPLEQVSRGDLKKKLEGARRRNGQRLSSSSKGNIISTWKRFFKWMHNKGYTNEYIGNKLPNLTTNSDAYKLPPSEDIQKVRDILIPYAESWRESRLRDALIVSLADDGGMRRKAIHQLETVDAINALNNIVTIGGVQMRHTISQSKFHKDVFITFAERSAHLLGRYLALRVNRPGTFLFTNRHGEQLSYGTIRNSFTRISKAAGCSRIVGCHMYRYQLATDLHRLGIPIKVISQILNHKSIETTLIYIQLDQSEVFNAMADLHTERGNEADILFRLSR